MEFSFKQEPYGSEVRSTVDTVTGNELVVLSHNEQGDGWHELIIESDDSGAYVSMSRAELLAFADEIIKRYREAQQ